MVAIVNVDERLVFRREDETMEVDFTNLHLRSAEDVDNLYDDIEAAIAISGQNKWYFLVNYMNCVIDPAARPDHSRRGSRLNVAHSLGTVRFDASDHAKAEIAKRPNQVYIGDNFFTDRASAVAKIAQLRTDLPGVSQFGNISPSQYTVADFVERIEFLPNEQIMDVNFQDFSFDNNGDVNGFYDHIEKRIAETGQKWYFLVNYLNCQITIKAWVSFAQRGKRLNIASSLGSVRYDASPETEAEIRARAQKQDFKPNIRASRKDALLRLGEMKRAASGSS